MDAFRVDLFALKNEGGSASATIDVGRRRPFRAWGSVSMVDPLTDFDRDNAFVFDGRGTLGAAGQRDQRLRRGSPRVRTPGELLAPDHPFRGPGHLRRRHSADAGLNVYRNTATPRPASRPFRAVTTIRNTERDLIKP